MTTTEAQTIITSLTDSFNVGDMIPILAAGLAAAAVLVFMWWAVRKLIGIITRAFKSGRARA